MSAPRAGESRFGAVAQSVAAVLLFFLARVLAQRAAIGLVTEPWQPLVHHAVLAFLLLLFYSGLGFRFNGQSDAVSAQGLPRRPGWQREAGLGLAFGWAVTVVCVVPLALVGGIAIVLNLQLSAWGWLLADAAFFAALALAEEVAFRGYAFQRFAAAVGPVGAAFFFSALYAVFQAQVPGSNRASVFVSIVLGLLLSSAYLRTKALWLGWGINFAWKASRALLFGLAICGINSHSPVVQGNPMGRFWLTGGGFGLDGSWLAYGVLLLALPVLFVVTRDLDFRYNAPVIVPGGMPVDLDAAARSQHQAAMGAAQPAPKPLVQILPAAAPPPASLTSDPGPR